MHAFLATQHSWLVVERLPAYAPDLNPVEGLWGNPKGTELANLRVDTIAETEYHARRGVRRIRKEKDLAFAFLRHTGSFLLTGLSLYCTRLNIAASKTSVLWFHVVPNESGK